MATQEDVLGKQVFGSDGEELGRVDAVFEDRDTRKPEWLAVARGLIGRKRVLVPFVRADLRETGVFLPYSTDQVEAAPELEGEEVTKEEERRLYAHYELEYSESRSSSGLPAGADGGSRGAGGRRSKTRSAPTQRGRGRRSGARTTTEPTRDDLYEEAKRLGVEGRSKMDKTSLKRAVGRKRGRSAPEKKGQASPIEVQKFLEGVGYPTGKRQLVQEAQSQGADAKVRSALERLPDTRFQSPAEVSKAIGRNS